MPQVNQEIQQEGSTGGSKLYPVDEGSRDSSFELFRQALLEAAKKHDRGFILSILDPEILNSFGGEGGVEEFNDHWKLDQPNSEFWDELVIALSMGGSFVISKGKEEFCAPYVFSKWESVVNQLPGSSDDSEFSAIVGGDVNVRLEPSSAATRIASLSFDVVRVDYKGSVPDKTRTDKFKWVKIITPTGEQGYVSGRYIRSPIDYRACFRKVGEKWMMTAFVAGD